MVRVCWPVALILHTYIGQHAICIIWCLASSSVDIPNVWPYHAKRSRSVHYACNLSLSSPPPLDNIHIGYKQKLYWLKLARGNSWVLHNITAMIIPIIISNANDSRVTVYNLLILWNLRNFVLFWGRSPHRICIQWMWHVAPYRRTIHHHQRWI